MSNRTDTAATAANISHRVTFRHAVAGARTAAEAVSVVASVMRGTAAHAQPLALEVQSTAQGDPAVARMVVLDGANLAAIRAALSWYQQCGFGDPSVRPEDISDLASAGRRLIPLDEAGVAQLECALDDAAQAVASPTPIRAVA